MKLETLRLVGVPNKGRAWFPTVVDLLDATFYVPMWMVQDCMDSREPVPGVKFDVAVDARRRALVLNPLVYAPGTRLARTEFRARLCRKKTYLAVTLSTVVEIFQLRSPNRFAVTMNRKTNALIISLKECTECTK